MLPYLRDHFGNPSSIHWAGRAVSGAVETAREQVAALLGVKPAGIVFTSCGSEGNNFLIKGLAEAQRTKGRHLITTAVEHPSVLETCRYLEQVGWELTCLPVDAQGELDLADLEKSIRSETVLISVMAGNNETGNLYPLEEIAAIAKKRDIRFHSDLVQATGKIPLDLERTGLDLGVVSAHKFGGPKGVGAVYAAADSAPVPLVHGGSQERKRRAGTLNVAGIVGLGAAAELAMDELDAERRRIHFLRDRLEDGLFARIDNLRLNGCVDRARRLPNTTNLSFCGVEAESLLMNLDLKGIAASSGSACSSGRLEPTHVISAMGVDPLQVRSSVRFSLGRATTAEDIDALLQLLPPLVERLRGISPLTMP
jgi:cysteine desulfurase